MSFLGCDMLDEDARNVLMEEARFRILRFATLYSKYKPGDNISWPAQTLFLWPESKIPWWFSHKSEESSISINLPHPDQWYGNSCLGLAACVILEFKDIISFWRGYEILSLCCDSVYMFPNGDSWRQTSYAAFSIPSADTTTYFCECCNQITTVDMVLHLHNHHRHPMSNCQYVFMFVDPTYGEFLASNDGQIDANGYMISYLGEYVKADQGSSDFDENEKSGFVPTATASFSFYLHDSENEERDVNRIAKVKKCGVHLLYTHETQRFEPDQEPESRGREAIYFESNQEGEEPLPKRIRA